MSSAKTPRESLGRAQLSLIAGAVLLAATALAGGSWPLALAGVGVLIGVTWSALSAGRTRPLLEPWPWPTEPRELAERMARPIDPTPQRLLPPDVKASLIAHVATTNEALSHLIADKPPAWPWAVFASVLVQRRNAVQGRLRTVASGYQPGSGLPPLSGQTYSRTVYQAMTAIADLVAQTEQFMLSPAFKGALNVDESSADPDAIVAIANRLMDYHEAFLTLAERCLQAPVQPEVLLCVQDMGAFTLCPLVGYEQFISTMCARIGEAQDLLPYTDSDTVIALDNVNLAITLPDGLVERLVAQTKILNP
jgi:hypothetical protein